MTYSNKFVAVIKSGGKILRESPERVVHLPYGAEYSIYLKNLNSKKAQVSISIDGESIGNSLLIEANESIELERFLENSLTGGHRFKFIQKTQEIVEHRGDRVDDGLVRIEVKYEKDKPVHVDRYYHDHHHWHDHWSKWPPYQPWITWGAISGTYTIGSDTNATATYGSDTNATATYGSGTNATATYNAGNVTVTNCLGSVGGISSGSVQCKTVPDIQPDEGLTVKGGHSGQVFQYDSIGELEENADVIVLRLKGYKGSVPVSEPVAIQTKLVCPTCGKHSKSNMAFCGSCGTSLS